MPDQEIVLKADKLRKEFRNIIAVDDVDLEIKKGDIFGIIGTNGSGKTTLIRMLATLLKPTSGFAYICGYDIFRKPENIRGLIGYMPDFSGAYDDLRVWEYLDFFAAAYRIPKRGRPEIIRDILELMDLHNKREFYISNLSRGLKQRLYIARTLIHDPVVLLLDEPASGLDPKARLEIREILKELRNMGKTILITSNILPELANLCNMIGIIEKGKLLFSGDINTLDTDLESMFLKAIEG